MLLLTANCGSTGVFEKRICVDVRCVQVWAMEVDPGDLNAIEYHINIIIANQTFFCFLGINNVLMLQVGRSVLPCIIKSNLFQKVSYDHIFKKV